MDDTTDENQRWAWVAGLFEGEGHISLLPYPNRPGSYRHELVLGMCDEDIVRRLRDFVGAGRIYYQPARKQGWSPSWRWHCGRWVDIERILSNILPWLGDRRRAKALEMLSKPARRIAGRPRKETCKRGHELNAENLYVWGKTRHCIPCRRIRDRERRAAKRVA